MSLVTLPANGSFFFLFTSSSRPLAVCIPRIPLSRPSTSCYLPTLPITRSGFYTTNILLIHTFLDASLAASIPTYPSINRNPRPFDKPKTSSPCVSLPPSPSPSRPLASSPPRRSVTLKSSSLSLSSIETCSKTHN